MIFGNSGGSYTGRPSESESLWKKMIGKSYSGKPNVRFDEGELEIEPLATTPALYSTERCTSTAPSLSGRRLISPMIRECRERHRPFPPLSFSRGRRYCIFSKSLANCLQDQLVQIAGWMYLYHFHDIALEQPRPLIHSGEKAGDQTC